MRGRIIYMIGHVFLFFFIFSLTFFTLSVHIFTARGNLSAEKIIVIPKGSGVVDTAYELSQHEIISNPYVFIAASVLTGQRQNLKAGEYQFTPNISMVQVLAKIVRGDVYKRFVTIPEGRTVYEVVKILNRAESLTGDITSLPREGSLMPDTYFYQAGQTRQSLIDQMAKAQSDFLKTAWEKRNTNSPLKTPDEALILASIVEKETSQKDEYQKVAGVFINRLNIGMKLQSDPTVIYGINLGKHDDDGMGPLGRRLFRGDVQRPSAYNTYTIDRLPPTPICNAGRASIMAVMNPEAHNYLYFVADGTGGHVFAATLDQHNQNAARWRAIRDGQSKDLQAKDSQIKTAP